ncbi:hypothetical protein [Paraclostridium sp. AKS73]|uniref:hypothetical protein n=1 Tax=Paraclostridium sp. AKS73 TaxID=2876116 RepID=UPI0021E00BC4|nr:hypothetical protein [Paraclostridium sp. AKS73]MCU9816459.1 hypothetical protein [Paraclostridium sp. AKS73]
MVNNIYENISKQLILEDTESALNIFYSLRNKNYEPIFWLQSIPYFSFLCGGILDFYNINNIEEITIKDNNIKKIISSMRIKTKLYSEGKSKPKKSIEELEKIHLNYYNYSKKLYDNVNIILKLIGLSKLYDFGTYSISDKYIGNIYLNYWYLDKILDIQEIGSQDSKKNIMLFSSGLGKVLGSVCEKENILIKSSTLDTKINIEYKDFLLINETTKIFNGKYDKYATLLLFNILSSVNFIIYFLGKFLPKDNKFYFRAKFICYYSSISSLEKLINYTNSNKTINTGIENYIDRIEKLKYLKNSFREDSNLRNCLFHYKIQENCISEKEIMFNVPFYGLIEKYTNTDYYDFNQSLDNNLKKISEMLEDWILK